MANTKTLLAGAAVLTAVLAGAAYAQQGPGAGGGGPIRERIAERFADRMGPGGPGGLRGGMAGDLRGVAALRIADANQDGAVTRAEADALQAEIFAWNDRNGDGALDIQDLGPIERRMAEARQDRADDRADDPWARPRPEREGARDANDDGRITLAELSARTDALFERLDADADGRITAEEAREAAPERRGGRRGPGGPGGPGAPDAPGDRP